MDIKNANSLGENANSLSILRRVGLAVAGAPTVAAGNSRRTPWCTGRACACGGQVYYGLSFRAISMSCKLTTNWLKVVTSGSGSVVIDLPVASA